MVYHLRPQSLLMAGNDALTLSVFLSLSLLLSYLLSIPYNIYIYIPLLQTYRSYAAITDGTHHIISSEVVIAWLFFKCGLC